MATETRTAPTCWGVPLVDRAFYRAGHRVAGEAAATRWLPRRSGRASATDRLDRWMSVTVAGACSVPAPWDVGKG